MTDVSDFLRGSDRCALNHFKFFFGIGAVKGSSWELILLSRKEVYSFCQTSSTSLMFLTISFGIMMYWSRSSSSPLSSRNGLPSYSKASVKLFTSDLKSDWNFDSYDFHSDSRSAVAILASLRPQDVLCLWLKDIFFTAFKVRRIMYVPKDSFLDSWNPIFMVLVLVFSLKLSPCTPPRSSIARTQRYFWRFSK